MYISYVVDAVNSNCVFFFAISVEKNNTLDWTRSGGSYTIKEWAVLYWMHSPAQQFRCCCDFFFVLAGSWKQHLLLAYGDVDSVFEFIITGYNNICERFFLFFFFFFNVFVTFASFYLLRLMDGHSLGTYRTKSASPIVHSL